jgi:hypothetical protein
VRDLIEAAGVQPRHLPPYSPISIRLRTPSPSSRRSCARRRHGTVDALWSVIGRLIDLITLNECVNMFAAAGYDPE